MNKIVAIIQARMNSQRLPGKVMLDLCGETVLGRIYRSAKCAKLLDQVVIATTENIEDDVIVDFCLDLNFNFFRGSETNVLERYYFAAKKADADIVLRLTGDNPLIDSGIIDETIEYFGKNNGDYLKYRDGFPIGTHIEIFTFKALERAYEIAKTKAELEHVTYVMYSNPEKFRVIEAPISLNNSEQYRLTIDSLSDYVFVRKIVDLLAKEQKSINMKEILQLLDKHNYLTDINRGIKQKAITD